MVICDGSRRKLHRGKNWGLEGRGLSRGGYGWGESDSQFWAEISCLYTCSLAMWLQIGPTYFGESDVCDLWPQSQEETLKFPLSPSQNAVKMPNPSMENEATWSREEAGMLGQPPEPATRYVREAVLDHTAQWTTRWLHPCEWSHMRQWKYCQLSPTQIALLLDGGRTRSPPFRSGGGGIPHRLSSTSSPCYHPCLLSISITTWVNTHSAC